MPQDRLAVADYGRQALLGGGDSSHNVSSPPNSSSPQLWGLSHSSHKHKKRRGPGSLRLADTPSEKWACEFERPVVSSSRRGFRHRPQAGQSHSPHGTVPQQPVPSFPGRQGEDLELPSSQETEGQPSRLGLLFSHGCAMHAQPIQGACGSPGSCLSLYQPAQGPAPEGSSSASPRLTGPL